MCSMLNQDPLKWSGNTNDRKYMFYFEFKNRRYICQQCGKAKTIANFGLSSSTSWSEKTKFCPHPSFDKVGKDPSSHPKIAKDTHLFSQPTSSMPWGRRSTIWDPRAPIRPPKPPYIPPQQPDFPYPSAKENHPSKSLLLPILLWREDVQTFFSFQDFKERKYLIAHKYNRKPTRKSQRTILVNSKNIW